LTKHYNAALVYVFAGFLISTGFPVFIFPKGEFALLVNRFHLPGLDLYFQYITWLGDGAAFIAAFAILLCLQYHYALAILFTIMFQLLLVHFFGPLLLSEALSPVAYLEGSYQLYLLPGAGQQLVRFFHSGHSAVAFSLAFVFAFIARKHKGDWAVLLFFLAFSVALSRIYLMQSFLVEVYAGAVVGAFSAMAGIWLADWLAGKSPNFWRRSLWEVIQKLRRSSPDQVR
jgi:membrane-associated phospholipid phosphatase